MRIFKSIKEIKYIKEQSNNNKAIIIGSGGFSRVKLVFHSTNPSKVFALKKLYKKDEQEIEYIKQEIFL